MLCKTFHKLANTLFKYKETTLNIRFFKNYKHRQRIEKIQKYVNLWELLKASQNESKRT